ncbi:hypothetical protein QF041_004223 [Paenibacillus sp. W2I17]|nr:hypothetical protein [Paenibacillus sp. W2I17]
MSRPAPKLVFSFNLFKRIPGFFLAQETKSYNAMGVRDRFKIPYRKIWLLYFLLL